MGDGRDGQHEAQSGQDRGTGTRDGVAGRVHNPSLVGTYRKGLARTVCPQLLPRDRMELDIFRRHEAIRR